MWMHWSMTRVVRWRIKDWASCFTTYRFPSEEEMDTFNRQSLSPPQIRIRNMVFDKKDDDRNRSKRTIKSDKKVLRQSKLNDNEERRHTKMLKHGSSEKAAKKNVTKKTKTNKNMHKDGSYEIRWSHFADEEYIVFCFSDDGTSNVVKSKSESSSPTRNSCRCSHRRSSWPLHQKTQISYTEDTKLVKINSHVERLHEEKIITVEQKQTDYGMDAKRNGNRSLNEEDDGGGGRDVICSVSEEEKIVIVEQPDEEESFYVDIEFSSGSNGGRMKLQTKGIENKGTASFETSESSQSETSTSSFAFPILGQEWMGSPAQMPRSEGRELNLRKHKARSLAFQCFRF